MIRMSVTTRLRVGIWAAIASALTPTQSFAQTQTAFQMRFRAIMSRPEYKHSRFGVEVYSLEESKVIYSWNPQELFVPGSTTKILSVGSALELLGPDFRFHTKIYRTGPVKDGTLDGDLVLVASGDPNLSNRIQPDGSMVFENEDHSYDGFAEAKAVPGDPLAVIRELALQVAAKGITHVTGRVLVDISLFQEGARDAGTGVVISPVVVNDNLVDVLVTPGAAEGAAASLAIAPKTRYVTISNDVKTGAPGSKMDLRWTKDTVAADGTHAVVLSGTIAADAKPKLRVYKVPAPSKYAETVLAEALEASGVRLDGRGNGPAPASSLYTTENEVAEHVSPPLQEEAKVTLKVSQNLHASMMPYIVGAYKTKGAGNALQAGFDQESALLQKADLDMTGAMQNDGAGGDALFTPDFMVQFLRHLTRQPFASQFQKSLPVLGKDGTLAGIQVNSPAAGHVFAKTGTFAAGNALTKGGVIMGKALAGFVDTKDGRHLAIAVFINLVPVKELGEEATQLVGEAVGEIAAAAYDGLPLTEKR
jgi:D-alanyl-D-alanine carboxypeptidase/D-alanyl-D-alanine-endopeptidase (penicillin-binding protein 4)